MKTLTEIKLEIKPIKSDNDYKYYLQIIDQLIDCEENSKEEELLELVSILVDNYEESNFVIEAPDPIEAIKLKMKEKQLKRKDLAIYFGSPSRVSEILGRRRSMTLEMAKKIKNGLGISSEILLS